MVSTHLKNISQIGSFPQVGVKIKNVWNHNLGYRCFGAPRKHLFFLNTSKPNDWRKIWKTNGVFRLESWTVLVDGCFPNPPKRIIGPSKAWLFWGPYPCVVQVHWATSIGGSNRDPQGQWKRKYSSPKDPSDPSRSKRMFWGPIPSKKNSNVR